MIVKKIEIEMVFPDDFVPPEKYYEENNQCHGDCPFWTEDFERGGWCKIAADGEECPLKKYFLTEAEEETPSEPIVSKEAWDEAQKIIPREELYKAIEESALRAEQEYYMKVMRVAINITEQKRRKEHGE